MTAPAEATGDLAKMLELALGEVAELERYGNAASRRIRPALSALEAENRRLREEMDQARSHGAARSGAVTWAMVDTARKIIAAGIESIPGLGPAVSDDVIHEALAAAFGATAAPDGEYFIEERADDMLIARRHWQGWDQCVARRPKLMSNDEWRPMAERIVAALKELENARFGKPAARQVQQMPPNINDVPETTDG